MVSNLSARVAEIQKKFHETWNFDGRDFSKPSTEEVLRNLIAECDLSERERLTQEFFLEGPLTCLLNLSGLQEVIVNGPEDIWVEAGGEFHKVPDRFLSPDTFKNFIDRLCAEAELKVDLAQPFSDGRWRDFRVHLGRAPLTDCEFHLCLRKVPENPWTFSTLREAGWAKPDKIEILRGQIAQRKNILFVGPTGCGKTTVLGASLRELAENERAVIIEDTDELRRPNSASTKMLTRAKDTPSLPEVTLSDLVRQSLRMRPSRLIMGEVRGPEAKDLLLALATGHSGSLGTLHASDPRQALLRLEMLVQLGAPQWNVQAVRQLIQLSVDTLVVCGNENGHRCLKGIYKVAALESFGFLLEEIV